MARTPKFNYSGVQDMVRSGKTLKEITEVLGCTYASASRYLRINGLKARNPLSAPQGRTDKILSMHRQGICMAKIGEQISITRERVRQILLKHGIKGREVQAIKALKKTESKRVTKNARCIAQHGVELEAYKAAIKAGYAHAYRSQKRAAFSRGVSWSLTFGEWFGIWKDSGKLELRGRGIGRFCMSRVCDTGGYELGNVHIQLCTENNSEFITKNRGKRNTNTGVYLLYPGLSKPWSARVSKKFIGNFATEEEATAARMDWLAQNPPGRRRSNRLGTGRGYHLCGAKFKVVIAKKYYGLFSTEAEALDKSRAVLETLLQAA